MVVFGQVSAGGVPEASCAEDAALSVKGFLMEKKRPDIETIVDAMWGEIIPRVSVYEPPSGHEFVVVSTRRRKCEWCGGWFVSRRRNARFCSGGCRRRARQ